MEFWLVIPALNEERVIAPTVAAALDLDTPGIPVHVVVVDDGSTDRTPAILDGIDDRRLTVLHRAPPEARRGKGAALNAAYREICSLAVHLGAMDRIVVGVLDADGRTTRESLAEVADVLAQPGVGACQTRVRIRNRTRLLAFVQDIEFACIADAGQSWRNRVGSVGLGGNGQYTRLSTLALLGRAPWSSCLVEDVELGIRLHLAGIGIRYTQRAVTSQQAVTDIRRLLRQRSRWAQGNFQCGRYIRKLMASREVTSLGLLDFLQYLLMPWLAVPLSIVIAVVLGCTIVFSLLGDTIPVLGDPRGVLWIGLTELVGVILFPGLLWGTVHRLSLRDEPYWRCLLAGFVYPGFLLLGVVATWRGARRQWAHDVQWDKTERAIEVGAEKAAAAVSEALAGGAARADRWVEPSPMT